MVLEDVTEFDYSGQNTKMSKILLNGNNVCTVSSRPEEEKSKNPKQGFPNVAPALSGCLSYTS